MDRIDIQVEIEPVEFDDMVNRAPAEPSSEIRKRVMAARAFDRILRVERTIADLESAQSLPPRSGSNSSEANAAPSTEYMGALSAAVTAPVLAHHIAEAIGYRALDRPQNFGIAL